MLLGLKKSKDALKQMLIPGGLFEDLGVEYMGPVDGHDVKALTRQLAYAAAIDGPVLLHVKTVKGKGVSFMESDILWHYRFPHEGEEYDGALKELHAAMPEGVVLSSGSAVRRPPRITLLKLKFAILLSLI